MKPHQKERVEILLGIKSDPHGKGYNVNQSIISIGSGGLSG
jgi:rod shape determining protein RodA